MCVCVCVLSLCVCACVCVCFCISVCVWCLLVGVLLLHLLVVVLVCVCVCVFTVVLKFTLVLMLHDCSRACYSACVYVRVCDTGQLGLQHEDQPPETHLPKRLAATPKKTSRALKRRLKRGALWLAAHNAKLLERNAHVGNLASSAVFVERLGRPHVSRAIL